MLDKPELPLVLTGGERDLLGVDILVLRIIPLWDVQFLNADIFDYTAD